MIAYGRLFFVLMTLYNECNGIIIKRIRCIIVALITKTEYSSTKANDCNHVTDCEHKQIVSISKSPIRQNLLKKLAKNRLSVKKI